MCSRAGHTHPGVSAGTPRFPCHPLLSNESGKLALRMAGSRAGQSVKAPRYGRAAVLAAAIVVAVMTVAYLYVFERERIRMSSSSAVFAKWLSGEAGLLVRNMVDDLFHMRNVLEQTAPRWSADQESGLVGSEVRELLRWTLSAAPAHRVVWLADRDGSQVIAERRGADAPDAAGVPEESEAAFQESLRAFLANAPMAKTEGVWYQRLGEEGPLQQADAVTIISRMTLPLRDQQGEIQGYVGLDWDGRAVVSNLTRTLASTDALTDLETDAWVFVIAPDGKVRTVGSAWQQTRPASVEKAIPEALRQAVNLRASLTTPPIYLTQHGGVLAMNAVDTDAYLRDRAPLLVTSPDPNGGPEAGRTWRFNPIVCVFVPNRATHRLAARQLWERWPQVLVGLVLTLALLLALEHLRYQRRRVHATARANRRRYQFLYDKVPSILAITDTEGRIQNFNRFGAERLGYRLKELRGMPITRLVNSSSAKVLGHFLRALGDAGSDGMETLEASCLHKNGKSLWIHFVVRAFPDPATGEQLILLAGEDRSLSRELQKELETERRYDAATGTLRHDVLEDRVREAVEQAREVGGHSTLAVLAPSHFDTLCDSAGHAAGNELLRHLGTRITRHISEWGAVEGSAVAVGRLSRGELGLLLSGMDVAAARPGLEALRASLNAEEFRFGDQRFVTTSAIGATEISGPPSTAENIIRQAQLACVAAAKGAGPGIVVYDPQDPELSEYSARFQVLGDIFSALEEQRFQLFVQRIQSLDGSESGEHFEVLVRMVDPAGKLIPPGRFLQVAEDYRVSPQIDRWVISNTLAWLDSHPDFLSRLNMCAINISGPSADSPNLIDFVRDELGRHRVPAQRIGFEITETAAVTSVARARDLLGSLQALGCTISLDDFGTGMASFAYLRNLPVDYVKIDGVFVKDITTDEISLATVKAISDLARVMGKKTIAEFVEDGETADLLRSLGVSFAQGYGIARPCPIDDLLEEPANRGQPEAGTA